MSPVGSPACPNCDNPVGLDVPLPFGLTTCSNCGERVWFLTVCSERVFFRYNAVNLVRRLFHELPFDGQRLQELQFDTLDIVELMVEFEVELEEAI